ncbi:TIM barrel protein [Desulfosporosinus sp.]|uniref:TIM barrel protein n=1 Tax=Desulfosporosinus sp. TaxID=157907 RepID=UPI0023245634|nr:TIM barrel protein [Desulfosporosinus sp.]MCO5388652.1 TIM barrel protein [Desulfosporosinus sp.]MDA8221104.1 TIM barrel protein [Desulfitobacterium hafniense]
MPLLFGTAGVPLSSKDRSSEGGVRRIRELNLGALEIEFVQGVRMGEEKARKVGMVAKEDNIALSCHAPYYINLNSREPEKITASRDRIIHTARISQILGVRSVVFHPAFNHDNPSEVVLERVVRELLLVRETLDAEGNHVVLRPETTGKGTQFGDLIETVKIAKEVPGVLPCIDFSHLHARTNGRYNSYDEFCEILDVTAESLGDRWVKNVHFHISGIEYGLKGEKRHLVLKESDLRFEELMKACHSFGVEGLAICESPNLEEDALLLQQTYRALG